MKRHSTTTLMGMTKAELVEYVRMCEHNREVAEQTLAQHIENVKDWKSVRHGRWVYSTTYRDADVCLCSECKQMMTTHHGERMPFCPGCGADMRGAENA